MTSKCAYYINLLNSLFQFKEVGMSITPEHTPEKRQPSNQPAEPPAWTDSPAPDALKPTVGNVPNETPPIQPPLVADAEGEVSNVEGIDFSDH
ncbi:hypothetical protein A2Z00_05655 [Candidatus Gottesmanbacteria bacterium RBG_13_45_10]|uniref:Uncharacterized protein n=1 Tax=Candidatus Gottesmanbacteria bacterium RBG_13_45_10 TaxID=1798370 RepID=A0A1F5ZG14_9BACT|nr:MAG: hypothetical protein A2Z00_05655 [Candidatus Gottesmanbacteria bacterium RBG_13_45_10]